jgi:uncharacterized protein (UPF0333 family)
MKYFKKGQTATEYLTILAVVIIIALIVVVAMGKFPGIGQSAVSRGSSAYWASADLAISSYSISESGTDTFVLKNNMRENIKITNMTVDGKNIVNTERNLGPGGSVTIISDVSLGCTAGQTYSYDVSLTYEDANGAEYTFTGAGNRLEGTCAK